MLLEINNLTVSYGAIRAVNGISLNVEVGKIVTIIGANGAGKSTTMKAISGLIKPDYGHIKFRNEEIANLKSHEIVRKGIVQVPEGRGIFGNLTVLENLEVASTVRKQDKNLKSDYDHVFSIFPRLSERLHQTAGTLSGGEQQMLAIARALISKGELLLLDEPSMGLSPSLVNEVFEIIKRINKEGTTILLVEQNAYKAIEISDSGYVLESGEIVLSGTRDELKGNPKIMEAYLGR